MIAVTLINSAYKKEIQTSLLCHENDDSIGIEQTEWHHFLRLFE